MNTRDVWPVNANVTVCLGLLVAFWLGVVVTLVR